MVMVIVMNMTILQVGQESRSGSLQYVFKKLDAVSYSRKFGTKWVFPAIKPFSMKLFNDYGHVGNECRIFG